MITFKAQSGNEYVYLQESGIVYPKKAFERRSETIKLFERAVAGEKGNLQRMEDPKEIKELIFRNGLQELTLEVTQKCNLRCKYCIYSESYPSIRDHRHKDMDANTAIKAIDLYFSLLRDGKYYNPYREPTIGFYGGEPLMNFEVIKRCVQHVTDNYSDFTPYFTITTNGTLLSPEVISFVDNINCGIILSLDGPKEEHDRNRVFPNGKGSFDVIMERLKALSNRDLNIDLYALAIYDWKTDLDKVDKFFSRNDTPLLMRAGPANPTIDNTYYKQFSKKDYETFEERVAEMYRYNLERFRGKKGDPERTKSSLYNLTLVERIVEVLIRYIGKYKNPYIPFTGACVPGFKMFVDCDGLVHVCEKMWGEVSIIGDIESGIDYKRIFAILKSYQSETSCCESCIAKNRCSLCYTSFAEESMMRRNPLICDSVKVQVRELLSYLWTIGEIDSKVFDRLSDEYYTLYKDVGKELL